MNDNGDRATPPDTLTPSTSTGSTTRVSSTTAGGEGLGGSEGGSYCLDAEALRRLQRNSFANFHLRRAVAISARVLRSIERHAGASRRDILLADYLETLATSAVRPRFVKAMFLDWVDC